MSAASLPRSAPRQLGRYELIAPLATGGMAELYLGRLRGRGGFEKLVAIKRMKPHLSDDPGFVDMFLDEGRIAARLTHPNVCQVYELGDDDGQLYMAMEYVPGIPLATILAALPRTGDGFDIRVTAGILIQVSEGVHYAHEHKADDGSAAPIVHRDVSPTNLLVTPQGVCKLVDFGIAKVLTEVSQTRTGVLKGKPSYMSPEQIRAEPVDRRADVFALGVVLWECIAGRRLFQGDSDFLIWQQITQTAVPSLRELRPEVPAALDAMVQRAVAKDPAARHETARAFAADVRRSVATLGGPLEPAALATYLSTLCGDAFAARAALVSQALAGEDDTIETGAAPPALDGADGGYEPTASIRLREHTAQVELAAAAPLEPEPRPAPSRPIALLVAAALLGVVVALVLARTQGGDRRPETAALTAPTGSATGSATGPTAATAPSPPPATPGDPAAGPPAITRLDAGAAVAPPTDLEVDAAPRVVRPAHVERTRPRPRPAPPPAEPAEPGFYIVDSRPYARIFIDGKDHGETPLFRVPLSPGRHAVRAELSDGRKKQFTIEIKPGKDLSSGRLRW